MSTIKYQDISKFKYVLYSEASRDLPAWQYGAFMVRPCVYCSDAGHLIVRAGYPWDGPSGPTIDTKHNIAPSFWHDVGYEAIRRGVIPPQARLYFDQLFYVDLIKKGMSKWRAKTYYRALRMFGGFAARRNRAVKYKVHEA